MSAPVPVSTMAPDATVDYVTVNPYQVAKFWDTDVSARPPVIKMPDTAKKVVSWAREVARASNEVIADAEPRYADRVFYQTLKEFREAVLVEIAKAEKVEQAVVAVSILFDRELLMLATSRESQDIKERVAKATPGEFGVLASSIKRARAEASQRSFDSRRRACCIYMLEQMGKN